MPYGMLCLGLKMTLKTKRDILIMLSSIIVVAYAHIFKELKLRNSFSNQIHSISIATKCLRALSVLFSPDPIDQSSCRILTTHAKTRPILRDDWSIRLGEDRI